MLGLVLIAVAVGYLGVCGLTCGLERRLIYFPQPVPVSGPLDPYGIHRVEVPGHPPVDVLHLPAPAGAPTVVHFHGNAEQLLDQLQFAQTLHEQGLGFYAIEYPGYGRSPGQPTEKSIYEAAETGIAALRAQGVSPSAIVLSGRSLGTGVAVEMARRGLGSRLVLVAPYTSIPDVGQRQFPWLPVRLLASDRFDSKAKAPGIRIPALIVHGDRDEVIPVDMGRELGRLLPNAKVLIVEGAQHNDVLGRDRSVISQIARFALGGR